MGSTKINLPDIPLRIVRVDGVTITGEGTRRSPLVASATSQIQSDWNQTNNTKADYIKNKPTASSISFTPSGGLSSTNIASALAELDTEKEVAGASSSHSSLTTGVHGAGVNTFVYSNDSRLTDSRTPTTHSQAESTITFTDITTGNVSISSHGYCPKLPNNTTTFLRGDGTYASPTASGLTYSQTFSMVSLRV